MSEEAQEGMDISEKGGQGRSSDRRLFMQFMAFGGCPEPEALATPLREGGVTAVVYEDLHDPYGAGVLTLSEDPGFFLGPGREVLRRGPFAELTQKPDFSWFGRTYALGYEPDLDETLVERPRRTALHPDWTWAIWYPLRRSGAFARLPEDEQKKILKEHGSIGFQYGRADLAHDIRLACHGLDPQDNDFLVALTGKELTPLSKVVEHMRGTQQTALYLERLGPFFVGRAVWKSPAGH